MKHKKIKKNRKDSKVYKVLNERKSWIGAMASTAFEKDFVVNDSLRLARISDEIEHEYEPEESGGLIVFPLDVNAMDVDNFVNSVKKFYHTWEQCLVPSIERDKEEEKHTISTWSVGNFFKRNYTADNGDIYNEKSMSIEIIGVDYTAIIRISVDLCSEFKQETVLVKSYSNNKIMIVKPL